MSNVEARLCWGFKYENGTEFPWAQEGGGGEEKWWREENNFKEGDDEDEFEKKFPIPFEVVYVCDLDDDTFILACPDMIMMTAGDAVLEVKPSDMMVAKKAHENKRIPKFKEFIDDLRKRGIDPENGQKEGQWLLSAFWDE